LYINAIKSEELRPRIMQEALASNAKVLSFGLQENSLEDILLRLVNKDVSDVPERRSKVIPSFFRLTRKNR